MANPIIPGIPQTEQDLLYSKLNAYNQGRASYKEVGAYLIRSEERRVGKECRSRWSPYH